jgi:hypothetical protein
MSVVKRPACEASIVKQSACKAKEFEIFQKKELENFLKKQKQELDDFERKQSQEQRRHAIYLTEHSINETSQKRQKNKKELEEYFKSNTELTPSIACKMFYGSENNFNTPEKFKEYSNIHTGEKISGLHLKSPNWYDNPLMNSQGYLFQTDNVFTKGVYINFRTNVTDYDSIELWVRYPEERRHT